MRPSPAPSRALGSVPSPSPDAVLAISFIAEAGKQMLESSTSVSEVVDHLRAFLPAVGLEGCAIDGNLTTLTISYWKPGQAQPLTLVREVEVSEPRLQRLAGTMSLLEQVERKELDLPTAYERLQELGQAEGRRPLYARIAVLVSVGGWVLFFGGLGAFTVLVALLATILALPVNTVVRRLRLPSLAGTFLAAIILAAVPNLMAGAGLSFVLPAAVVGGLFIYLPGRALVSAVVDGLANSPVSALTRAFEAIITAGALALGVVVGGRIGAGLGADLHVDTSATPLWLSLPAAALGVLGLALAWGSPRLRVIPTVLIGVLGWLVVYLATQAQAGGIGWAAYLVAAILVGFLGQIVAYIQGGSASIYVGASILPLVPGFTFYQGVLALTQGDSGARADLYTTAAISLAIAGGVAIGLALGRNLRELGSWVLTRGPLPDKQSWSAKGMLRTVADFFAGQLDDQGK